MIGVKLILAGIGILVMVCIFIAIIRIKKLQSTLNKEIIDYSVLAKQAKEKSE